MTALPATHSAMKLAAALDRAGLTEMAAKARTGWYHDYLSPNPTPDLDLMRDLTEAHHAGNIAAETLIARHAQGDFDATREESDAWAESSDGQAAYANLLGEAAKCHT